MSIKMSIENLMTILNIEKGFSYPPCCRQYGSVPLEITQIGTLLDTHTLIGVPGCSCFPVKMAAILGLRHPPVL